MKLKWMVLFCFGLLLGACGDKNAGSTNDMILAVRSLEDNDSFSNGDKIQVALLDAGHIQSEDDAKAAAEDAQWVSVDNFSSNNLVFSDADNNSGSSFAVVRGHRRCSRYIVPADGRRHGDRRYGDRRYGDDRRHGDRRYGDDRRRCWRPYRHDHWTRRISVKPIVYYGCPRGYFLRRGRCVIPFTPVHNYYWEPRYVYRVVYDSRRRRPRRHHLRGGISGRIRISFYW